VAGAHADVLAESAHRHHQRRREMGTSRSTLAGLPARRWCPAASRRPRGVLRSPARGGCCHRM